MSSIPIISNSERNTFGKCPQRWAWAYLDGLRPKGKPADASQLRFRSAFMRPSPVWYDEDLTKATQRAKTWKLWVRRRDQVHQGQLWRP